MTVYYRIEQFDNALNLYRVYRGGAFDGQEFDGRFPVPVFGPASERVCREFVRQVCEQGRYEFAARDDLLAGASA
jgi:hypothetical protein